jgi:hypothetical protein
MHIIVCYTAGIASSHELVLCVCCFGFSMLTTHLANSTLSRAENEEYTRANMNRKETEKSALFFKTVISTQTLHVSPCIRIRKTSGITVSTRVNTELPFIFLSFCAKGVLCIALTFPWVFADRRGVELQPLQCTLWLKIICSLIRYINLRPQTTRNHCDPIHTRSCNATRPCFSFSWSRTPNCRCWSHKTDQSPRDLLVRSDLLPQSVEGSPSCTDQRRGLPGVRVPSLKPWRHILTQSLGKTGLWSCHVTFDPVATLRQAL